MSTRLQVILLIVLILAIGFIVSEISKKKIDFKFGIVWIVISLVLILFTIWEWPPHMADPPGWYCNPNQLPLFAGNPPAGLDCLQHVQNHCPFAGKNQAPVSGTCHSPQGLCSW